uniref:Uncharacterized protein n=1 Tax=Anguilla anguilla TaxID=7936 RepID=A0A0E9QJ71_ANGAN
MFSNKACNFGVKRGLILPFNYLYKLSLYKYIPNIYW